MCYISGRLPGCFLNEQTLCNFQQKMDFGRVSIAWWLRGASKFWIAGHFFTWTPFSWGNVPLEAMKSCHCHVAFFGPGVLACATRGGGRSEAGHCFHLLFSFFLSFFFLLLRFYFSPTSPTFFFFLRLLLFTHFGILLTISNISNFLWYWWLRKNTCQCKIYDSV